MVQLVYYGGMQGTGAMPDIYSWTATHIRVQLTVTSTGAGDSMREMLDRIRI